MQGHKIVFYLLHLISLVCIIWIGYFIDRSQTVLLLSLFAFLFSIYFYFVLHSDGSDFALSILISIFFRFILLFSIPTLSDDFYRFIWDGHLIIHGESPFAKIPSQYSLEEISQFGLTTGIFTHLNSPNYYSIYPPICQYIFFIGSYVFPNNTLWNVVTMKAILLAFEIGSLLLLILLLKRFNHPKKSILIYALNPLVIIELSGNLHFEGTMIFFLLLSIYLITFSQVRHWIFSAAAFALALATKLIPLILIPLLFQRLEFKRTLFYFGFLMSIVVILFIPLINYELVTNFFQSLKLYFQLFEFNASIQSLLKLTEWRLVSLFGNLVGASIILWIAYSEKNTTWNDFFETGLLCLSIYYFFSTTVHPWYLTVLVALSVFTTFRFAILWSCVSVWSYSAYHQLPYQQMYWLIALEYAIVFSFFTIEIIKHQKRSELSRA